MTYKNVHRTQNCQREELKDSSSSQIDNNSAAKFRRTQAQGTQKVLQTLSQNIDQFKSDFGSPINPELVSVSEINCFLMLTGIPSNGLFNRPINNPLASKPDAKFTDPAALAATLLNYEKSSALLHFSDTPSTQASAYLNTAPQLPRSPLTTFCVHCHKKYPKRPKTNSHTSASCGLNPVNRLTTNPSNLTNPPLQLSSTKVPPRTS